MKVRLGTIEVDDDIREIIYRYHYGKKGLASRADVRWVYEAGGHQLIVDMESDLVSAGVEVR